MQTKRVKCPKCGVVLDVKNSKDESVKRFVCPSCKVTLQVKFSSPQPQEPLEPKTFYAPPKQPVADNGTTQLAGASYGTTQYAPKKTSPSSHIRLMFEEKEYALLEGQNIVGRKGTTSKATIQIETEDRYMSRQHCIINVSILPDGSPKAVLSNYLNKNQTSVNGQVIGNGDEIRLTNGDRIKMGHTTVVFKL